MAAPSRSRKPAGNSPENVREESRRQSRRLEERTTLTTFAGHRHPDPHRPIAHGCSFRREDVSVGIGRRLRAEQRRNPAGPAGVRRTCRPRPADRPPRSGSSSCPAPSSAPARSGRPSRTYAPPAAPPSTWPSTSPTRPPPPPHSPRTGSGSPAWCRAPACRPTSSSPTRRPPGSSGSSLPKLTGLRVVSGALDAARLRHVVLFSSVAGFFGNRGQSDYAMANGEGRESASPTFAVPAGCRAPARHPAPGRT